MALSALLWTTFYLVHSVFASLTVKAWVHKKLPALFPFYRILYNGFAIGSFMLVSWYVSGLPDTALWETSHAIRLSGIALLIFGLVMLVIALANYNLNEFVGIEPMAEFAPGIKKLTVTGPNRWMRHPLYTATLILLVGYVMLSPTRNTLLFVCISAIYIVIGSILEEKKLVKFYGSDYINYRERVKRFFPGLF
jgi:methanethiol S-methyltransferase